MRSDKSPYEPTETLFYTHASVQDLMADLETLARGLPDGAVLRVRADASEVWRLVPEWCTHHGYRILHMSDNGEGERQGGPAYLQGRYLFDLARAARDA